MVQNINVSTLYIPTGITIPWESENVQKIRGIGSNFTDEDEDTDVDVLFYSLSLESPPSKSTLEINGATGQLIIAEKGGNRAMVVPLGMICAIGTQGSVLLPTKAH